MQHADSWPKLCSLGRCTVLGISTALSSRLRCVVPLSPVSPKRTAVATSPLGMNRLEQHIYARREDRDEDENNSPWPTYAQHPQPVGGSQLVAASLQQLVVQETMHQLKKLQVVQTHQPIRVRKTAK